MVVLLLLFCGFLSLLFETYFDLTQLFRPKLHGASPWCVSFFGGRLCRPKLNAAFVSITENEIVGIGEPSVNGESSTANEAAALGGDNNVVGTDLSAMGQPNERYKAISLQAIDKVAEDHPQLKPHLWDVKLAGLVFPFKASPYYVDELVDWEADDVTQDPFYKLVFPTLDMLSEEHRAKLEAAHDSGDPKVLIDAVGEIRADLNPHPAGQKTLNAPKDGDDLNGVQHKYSETVLVFPAAAQTCKSQRILLHVSCNFPSLFNRKHK